MSGVMEKEIFRLRRLLKDTLDQRNALAKFAQEAFDSCFDGLDWDGAAIQEHGEKLGLLVPEAFDPKVHNSELGAICEPGDTVYFQVRWLKLAAGGTQ
ncbi:hypothetical protein [Halomonas sp. M20]|uniref:hypothetical protein n=1 Tax=Halomonas sp. M20 TaxID=2763264 RepID=UPI001D0A66EE|nr:hypothetical protein [Halomonas sp. M20]